MEPPIYRPVSGLAIAGLAVAVIYAGVVVLVGVSVWRAGTPLLMTWALVLAAAGTALSLTARRRILRSEGMQAGLRLASWGLRLSIVLGLMHGAIIIGKDTAVRQDAAAFSADWFSRLRQGDVHGAFLLTVPATLRQGDSPDDLPRLQARYGLVRGGRKGPLLLFREHELVQIIRQAGPAAKIESQGVRDWSFVGGGYLVEQDFRVITPEGAFDVIVPMWGDARPAGGTGVGGARWHVVMGDQLSVRQRSQTALGETLQAMRVNGARFAEEWARKLSQGLLVARDGLFHTDHLLAANDALPGEIRRTVQDLGTAPADFQLRVREGRVLETCPWKIESGGLQITLPVLVRLSGKYECEGTATVAAADPELVSHIQEGGEGPAVLEARRWRLVGFDLLTGARLSDDLAPTR